jgi:hypothetical protein
MWMMLACLVPALAAQAADSVTGTYKMKNGEVLVQQTDGGIRFALNATWQTNVGEVSDEVPLARKPPAIPMKTPTAS